MTALLTLERSLQLGRLCSSILEIDKKIQLVVIINQRGRIIEKKMRDDWATKDLIDQKKEMLFMGCALQISMSHDFDPEFGTVRYTFMERKTMTIFSFPLAEDMVVVISEPNITPISFGKKITKIIEDRKTRIKQVILN